MKIVHISTYPFGGAGIAAMRLHNSLNSNNIESYFLNSIPVSDSDQAKHFSRATVYHNLKYRILNRLQLLPFVSKKEKLEKEINSIEKNYEKISLPYTYYNLHEHPLVKSCDIVHLHWVSDFLDYPSFFQNIKKPIVWTFHDMNYFQGIFHYENDILDNRKTPLFDIENKIREEKKNILAKVDNLTIVTPSQWLLDKYHASSSFNPNFQSLVIPYTLPEYIIPTDPSNVFSSEKLEGLNSNPTFFFIADNINLKRKGLNLLIDALLAFDKCPINLITLGSGKINEILENNKLLNIISVNLTNDTNLINQLYRSASFTILPSLEDNLPNVILESFMNGTPIISFSNGGMAEHIKDSNGILIKDEINADNLLKAINYSIDNIDKFDRSLIKQYFKETFSFDNTTQKYINLYKSLL